MSTAVWPPVAEDVLAKEIDDTLARELQWLLNELQETLKSLKSGLDECATLLAPSDTPSTLPLSSHRSETIKGIVTREGTRIVKGDIKLRLATLPPPRGSQFYPLVISSAPHAPTLVLDQLTSARTLINACLDVVDACAWAGKPDDAHFIAGQLRLLDVNIQEAKDALKGDTDKQIPWWNSPVDEKVFDPPIPPQVSFYLSVVDGALRLEIRMLEPANQASHDRFSPFSRFAEALGGSRPMAHDEMNETFTYKGQAVKVKEKVRVESSDPILMATLAKLNALERNVAVARRALNVVMGKEE